MKKFLCAVLALCMVLALAACGSDGGDDNVQPSGTDVYPNGVTPTDLDTSTPEPTPEPEDLNTLTIKGIIDMIKNGQITGMGYEGFSYEDGKLVLTDVHLSDDSASGPIVSFDGGDLEIVISGDCSITTVAGVPVIAGGEGCSLTISGDGTLTLSADAAAAIDVSGNVTVNCGLNATGAPATSSAGVTAGDGFSITANEEGNLVVSAA